MTVEVTFQGVNYDIPEEDDSGWADLTSYLVALSAAAVGTVETKEQRVATATPVSVSATEDYAVGVNYAGASVVNLPTGSTGRIVVIYDASGAAAVNNITINGDSGQKINGRDDYVIRSNYGAVQLQFGTSEWAIISSRNVVTEQNATNLSVVDATVAADNDGVTVTNLQACTLTFLGKTARFIVEADGESLECACSLTSNTVDCLWDTGNLFQPANSGSGIAVTKSSNVITIRNRLGTSADFKIKVLVGQVSAATAWS